MNIAKNKLQELAAKTQQLVELIKVGVDWSDNFEKDNAELAYQLKYYRRKLKKIYHVVEGKPAIAFFGASQVGKSYMVNSLLCDDSKKLYIADHRSGDKVDFIKDVNPEGHGNESTSVVTRFTTDKPDPNKPPVKIKLLSGKDLINILCDSYFSDVKDKAQLPYEQRKEHIAKLLKHIESLTGNQVFPYFEEDDVYDIQEYLELNFQHSSKDTLELFKSMGYWHRVAKNISLIPPQKWHEVFSILWNDHAYISNLFQQLVLELEKLKFPKVVYSDFSAVRRNVGAIIDVQTLDGLFTPSANTEIQVIVEDGSSKSIKNSALCALCSEVVLSIAGEYSAEIKVNITQNIDVLDFPGARTRMELHEESIGNINVKEMVLRGKVSYLFNSYSYNYEINNLFVCMRTTQTNVRGVPSLVKSWMDFNIGMTPEERYKTLENAKTPPLFVIFTWWNTLLGFSSATDTPDPKERVEKWLKTRFKEEIIADYDWNNNWIRHNGITEGFHNYYLLRDFIKSYDLNKIFDRQYLNEARTEYQEVESAEPSQKMFLDTFKKVFTESDLVRGFFKNPTLNWEEASVPNKDGTELILKNILAVADNQTRTKRYLNQLNEWKEKVYSLLKKYYFSDNADEEILKAAREVADIHGYMNKVFGLNAYYFGNFIEKLTISEEEIKILYHDKLGDAELLKETAPVEWIHFIEYSPRLSPDNSYEQNLKILKEDYHLDADMPLKEVEAYFREKWSVEPQVMLSMWNTQRDKSVALAEAATKLWLDKRLNIKNFNYFVEAGFEKSALDNLLENISRSYKRLNISKLIASKIAPFVDRLKRLDIAEDMIAHITAGLINNFITTLGQDYYSTAEWDELQKINELNNLRINLPDKNGVFHALDEASIDKLFEFMANLNENLRKVPLEIEVMRKVPMISNYQRWRDMIKISFIANCNIPNYDPIANRQLGDMLAKIDSIEFTI